MDTLQRGERAVHEGRDIPPALLVERHAHPPDLGVGTIEAARDARVGRGGDDVAQRARQRLAPEGGRQLRPLLGVEPGVRDGAVVVLERAAALRRPDQLDALELEEDLDVVGDVGQRRVEQARELGRAGVAAQAQSFEDPLP